MRSQRVVVCRKSRRQGDPMSHLFPYSSELYATIVAFLLGFAAWRDVATRIIPDSISVALIFVGAVVRIGQGWDCILTSLLMSVAIFVALLPLCSRGLLGGADLKLLTALAVGLSPQASLHLLLCVTTLGGLLAAIYLIAAKLQPRRLGSSSPKSKSRLGRIATIESWRIRRRAPLPYGIAIAIGATFVVLQQQGV